MRNLCLVFDLDDTLYLERDYVLSGFRAIGQWVRANLGDPTFAHYAWRFFQEGAGDRTLQQALSAMGQTATQDLVSAMLHIYRTHSPDIALLPDAAYCIAELKELAELGIITDGRPQEQLLKCTRLGLPALFQNIVCTGTWGEEFYKPHARAFEFMEGQLGIRDPLFIYVADNPLKDFGAPLARGWKTIRIRRPSGLNAGYNTLPGLEPHVELQDLWTLPDVVKRIVETA